MKGCGSLVTEPQPPTGAVRRPGAVVELHDVVSRAAGAGFGDAGVAAITLRVPPGQSVALLSQPPDLALDVFDAIAGLKRPRAGEVRVDGVAVHRLGGREASRYRAGRGLVSPRYPLLESLPVIDNVLAAPTAGRADSSLPGRAAALLEFTGVARLGTPVAQLAPEERWRVMIARALVQCPRLVLAEDPATELDARAVDWVLDVLLDAHAKFGFTLILAAGRLAAAVRCERRVSLVDGAVAEDEMADDDDGWTRGRIDRIG